MIKVLALICSMAAPEQCAWKTVTTSDFADVSMQSCLMGAPQVAEWMRGYPGYRLQRWACQMGDRPERSAT